MATLNFLYRSLKPESFLTIRLLYRINTIDYVIGEKTEIKVSKAYWLKHDSKKFSDVDDLNLQTSIKAKITGLSVFILNEFNKTNPDVINKDWLKKNVNDFYHPQQDINLIPSELLKYFDFYIQAKRDLKIGTIKKIKVIKGYVSRYAEPLKNALLIKDVNASFKNNFETYMLSKNYDKNTISVALKNLRIICNHAGTNDIEVSRQLKNVTSKYIQPDDIYLTAEDITKIKNIQLEGKKDDARDFLLIACYSAQRISDYMRFNIEMIQQIENFYILKFIQTKTGKPMAIPLSPEFVEILNKRNFNFPKAMPHQTFNRLIKDVCKEAGITEMVQGSKKINDRQIKGIYPKYELVSGHLGRKTYITLNWNLKTMAELAYISGHSTEKSLRVYMKMTDDELAVSIAKKYFK